MKSRIILFLLGTILLSIGCTDRKQEQITLGLVGSWRLDSISIPDGSFLKNSDRNIIAISKKGSDSYEWWNFDVGNTITGKYFVLLNPQRKVFTLSFIPDIEISEKDTIRQEYKNWDIEYLKDDRLVLVEETRWINREKRPSILFNKKYIYKRIDKQ